MIGYYIHHHGKGHLHRACAVAAASPDPIVGLSSLPRPRGWSGAWVRLDQDNSPPAKDVTAAGHLHWAPLGHGGLRTRMAEISAWIGDVQPRLMMVDVSVEVALLTRLHGIPVATVLQPGDRSDPVHTLGYGVSDALIGCWPPGADPVRLHSSVDRESVHEVGGLSRFAVERRPRTTSPAGVHAVVLTGAGGDDLAPETLKALRSLRPSWRWTVLGRLGEWVDDPTTVLRSADVVVTHGGQNAISEVAAMRIPAVILPQARPYDEQHFLASTLTAGDWPAVAAPTQVCDWGAVLDAALAKDGSQWVRWSDDNAPHRFLEVCQSIALPEQSPRG